MIKLKNVFKNYVTNNQVTPALKNINLEVKRGEIFGVIGRSGAGKSTLIRCVNLLEPITSGQVIVNNLDLTTLSAPALRQARRKIGMIFQHFSLLNTKTVFENIAFPLRLLNKSEEEIKGIVLDLLAYVQLSEKKDYYPAKLSGGQKQRVAIARALANQPEVLLCDEATSAIDAHTTQSILNLLLDANQHFGLTIMLITHEMDVVKQICDRVALLHHGELIEDRDSIDFFTNPQTIMAQNLVNTCLIKELPLAVQKKLIYTRQEHTNPLLRIFFYDQYASQPIISELIQTFNLTVNIIQANIDSIKNYTIGILTLELLDHNHQLDKVITFLESRNVRVEVLGYV